MQLPQRKIFITALPFYVKTHFTYFCWKPPVIPVAGYNANNA